MKKQIYNFSREEILKKFSATTAGLSDQEAKARLKQYGFNAVKRKASLGWFTLLIGQFNNALAWILLVAAGLSFVFGEYRDTTIILIIVGVNGLIGFLQEFRAEKTLENIRKLTADRAIVFRGGEKKEIDAKFLVPGDVVSIASGDRVPADGYLLEGYDVYANEFIFTGESKPGKKIMGAIKEHGISLADTDNMLLAGTSLTRGQALMVVTGTGMETELGKIAHLVNEVKEDETPLQKQMRILGRDVTVLAVLIGTLVVIAGYYYNVSWYENFIFALALSVSVVPEGLPAAISVALSLGMRKLLTKNVLAKKLNAVETLASVSIICTDKTGTLTSNELGVQSIVTAKRDYSLDGEIAFDQADLKTAITGVILCNDAQLHHLGDGYETHGNPIDVALMMLGHSIKFDINLLQKKLPRTDLIPYETEHKFMATLHHDHDGNNFIYVKGAPEIILAKCKSAQVDGHVVPIDRSYWEGNIEKLASLGQRVIAVASKKAIAAKSSLNFDDIEDDLVLVALFGLIDPPREEAKLAVKECQQAGIKVKMITGDHASTASAIAAMVGIKNGTVLTGDMIDLMSDEDLAKAAPNVNVYARTTPQHKLRLVKALQQQGEVVAMTGDGINDAPALKQADIGIAMGEKGADLAKESAAMVLADDDFATLVHAVDEGRTIYDNLQKAILFILPTSFAQAFAVIVAILFGLTLPVTAVQILWVNMITAVTLSLALGFEPAASDVMQRPPRKPDAPLLSWYLLWRAFLVSLVLVAAIFGLFIFVYYRDFDLEIARTVAVNVLVIGEIMYLINCRNLRKSSINLQTFFGSRPILLSILVVLVLQLLFTYVPLMQSFFNTAAIGLDHWSYIIGAAVIVFVLVEIEKAVLRV
ncbi:MAG TPA: carbonate dehydratase [Coxiellaceae bacterium]|nr:carbonate dehydratase [Coxiellaceae bacterium]